MGRVARPKRYPRDARLSQIVDEIQVIEDELRGAGDYANALRMSHARMLVADVAMGVKR
jgi:hypothetical protein